MYTTHTHALYVCMCVCVYIYIYIYIYISEPIPADPLIHFSCKHTGLNTWIMFVLCLLNC